MAYFNINDQKQYREIPSTYGNSLGYNYADFSVHYADGFSEIVEPVFNPDTERKGSELILVVNTPYDYFTYEVFQYTQQEIDTRIQSQLTAQAEADQVALAQQLALDAVVSQQQTLPDNDALEVQAIYPMWNGDFKAYILNEKCQHFNSANELKLYKCVQAHTSQLDWNPANVPALFTQITPAGQIDDWVQPTGAQDAYQIGDKVTHNGFTWESINANNVWEPGVFGWIQI